MFVVKRKILKPVNAFIKNHHTSFCHRQVFDEKCLILKVLMTNLPVTLKQMKFLKTDYFPGR